MSDQDSRYSNNRDPPFGVSGSLNHHLHPINPEQQGQYSDEPQLGNFHNGRSGEQNEQFLDFIHQQLERSRVYIDDDEHQVQNEVTQDILNAIQKSQDMIFKQQTSEQSQQPQQELHLPPIYTPKVQESPIYKSPSPVKKAAVKPIKQTKKEQFSIIKSKSRKKNSVTIDYSVPPPKPSRKPTKLKQAQYDRDYVNSRIRNIQDLQNHHNNYGVGHPRTIQAEDFVYQIKQKRNEERRQYLQYQRAKREEAERARQQEMEEKEYEREQERLRRREQYESKMYRRMEQKEEEQRRKEEIKLWRRQYERDRPLQLEREQEYRRNVVIPQLEAKHRKLLQIRAQRQPIDSYELRQHQQRYLDLKHEQKLRRQAEQQFVNQDNMAHQAQINQNIFKGKYRYMVLEQLQEERNKVTNQEIEQSKKDRIKAYNDAVRRQHKEVYDHHRNDQAEANEAEAIGSKKFIRRVRKIDGSMRVTDKGGKTIQTQRQYESTNLEGRKRRSLGNNSYQEDGLKNLHYVKSKVSQHLQRQKEINYRPQINFIMEKQVDLRPHATDVRPPRPVRPKKSLAKEVKDTAASYNDQVGAIMLKADNADRKLREREAKIKHAGRKADKNRDAAAIEKDYLDAIHAKIGMLNKID